MCKTLYYQGEEVLKPVEALCELVLPGENPGGNLRIPGPSIIDAMKASIPNTIPSRDNLSVISNEEKDREECDRYVNILIGNMMFLGYVVVSAEPTYSKYRDETGAPIYARVAVAAKSIHIATKNDMRNWIT